MPMSAKDPDKAAGDAPRTNDEDLTKELNHLFAELRQVAPLDPRNPFDFGRFCHGFDKNLDVTELAKQLESQALDQQHNNLTELAERFKAKGNQHFREKTYREAVHAYTQGLKLKCPDQKLNSILHSNRASAFMKIGDLQPAFRDCVFALKRNITNYKAAFRCAECILGLKCRNRLADLYFWIMTQHEKNGIKTDDTDYAAFLNKYLELLDKTTVRIFDNAQKVGHMDSTNPNIEGEKRALLAAFKERGYRFDPHFDLDDVAAFDFANIYLGPPLFPLILENRVRIYPPQGNNLLWSMVMLVYNRPATGLCSQEFQNCMENWTLDQLFSQHFARPFSWDSERAYRPDNVVYHMPLEVTRASRPEMFKVVPSTMTLRDALATPGHIIVHGVPVIFVFTKQQAEKLAKDSQ